MLVYRHMGGRLWLRFVRLGRRKTEAGLILDIVTINRIIVCRVYGCGQLEERSETEVRVPTYLMIGRGGCDGFFGHTAKLLRGSTNPTQFSV